MLLKKMGLMIRALLIVFGFSLLSMGEDAEARAGGKRSFGQRSQPTAQPRSPNPPPAQQQMQPPSNRGGFMKGLAGGLAGGLIGSMLFSSMAQGAGLGGGGGGIGLFDIILIAGLLYVAYRFWKSRQNQNRPAFAGASPSMGYSPPMDAASATMARSSAQYGSSPSGAGYFGQGSSVSSTSPYMTSGPRLDRETVEDIFFRVQGAWTRRDLTPVQDYVERDVARVLDTDLQDLKDRREVNRLENISVRNLEFSEPWYEGDRELVRVRFTASLLDYTVDESTGALKSGSNTEPVKFDEYWVFAKSQGRSSWQLAGIEQI